MTEPAGAQRPSTPQNEASRAPERSKPRGRIAKLALNVEQISDSPPARRADPAAAFETGAYNAGPTTNAIACHVDPSSLLPPPWLIRTAVAAVWLYEGLWCKLLRGQPHELEVVESVPYFGPRIGALFLRSLGVVEVALAIWVLSAIAPVWCAWAQTLLLVTLNANGLIWARRIIHDPGGMVIKNFAFLILGWLAAGLPPRS